MTRRVGELLLRRRQGVNLPVRKEPAVRGVVIGGELWCASTRTFGVYWIRIPVGQQRERGLNALQEIRINLADTDQPSPKSSSQHGHRRNKAVKSLN